MFYSEDQLREYEDSMAQDCMSQGEYMTAALHQYGAAYGETMPERAWILTPFDTWEKNPYYVGPPVRHPEDDCYDEEEDVPAFTKRRLEAAFENQLVDPEFDEIPF